MDKTYAPNCPDTQTLSEFLLGKLEPEKISECEQHLAACEPCIETINGLRIDDTLNALVIGSGEAPASDSPSALCENESQSEQSVISNLIHRMSQLTSAQRRSGRAGDLQSRAADVLGLLEADQNGGLGRIQQWRLEQIVGAGSTGVVFRAIDESLDRPVAIKVLRPTLGEAARERFLAEARTTASLNDTNVVTIYHVGTTPSLAFIVMQWLPGETLEQRLEKQQSLAPEQVVHFGKQIASGLAAAHDRGLVHRDIKPANLWITENNEVKILDFGLVRIMDEDPQLTCTGMIAGTPCYMSPEQSRGDELDIRSDLFSLGCVLYQCLTGKLPFTSGNALATLQLIQRETPASPNSLDPSISMDLSDVVMKLLEKAPGRRPDSASDVAMALEADRDSWPFACCHYATQPVLAQPERKPVTSGSGFFRWAILATGLGLAGFAAWIFAPQIIRVATDQGQIIIESNDPDVEIEVLRGGEVIKVVDLKTEQKLEVQSGAYQIRTVGDENSVSIDKDTLTLLRGETEIVKVTRTAEKLTNETASNPDPNPGKVAASDNLPGTAEIPNASRSVGPSAEVKPTSSAMIGRDPIDPNYLIRPGDILSVFVDNVLGRMSELNESALQDGQSLGYPIHVKQNGQISLPLIDPVTVEGKTAFVVEEELKKRYLSGKDPILDPGYKPLVSVTVRQIFSGNRKATPLQEPVYDGLTLDECLNVVKFELDGDKLKKPVLGLMKLSSRMDSETRKSLVEPLFDAILLIVQKSSATSERYTDAFYQWLDDESFQKIARQLSESGSQVQWSWLFTWCERDWSRLGTAADTVVQRAIGLADSETTNITLRGRAIHFMLEGYKHQTRELQTKTLDCLINNLPEFGIRHNQRYDSLARVAKLAPEASGLGKCFAECFLKHPDSFQIYTLGTMGLDNQAEAVKPVLKWVKKTMKQGLAREGQVTGYPGCDYFIAASDEIFEQYLAVLREVNHKEIPRKIQEFIARRKAEQAIK